VLSLERLEDRTVPTTFTVVNTLDSGPGSLRQAILDANASAGANIINFNIPADDARHFYYKDDGVPGQVSLGQITNTTAAVDSAIADIDPDHPQSWWSIQPMTGLGSLGGQVTVDGTSQPGYAGTPNIELDGSLLSTPGTGALGFSHASGCAVRGLAINRFPGPAIGFSLIDHGVIQGNFIGTDISGRIGLGIGTLAFGAGNTLSAGIDIEQGSDNLIGSDGDGVNDLAERNVISAGAGWGLVLGGDNEVVAGNYIGTDVTGTASLGAGYFGVFIAGDHDRIGTSGHEADNAAEANLISGNGGGGMDIKGQYTVVAGNYIGTDASGTQAIPNSTFGGILVDGASFNRIGTDDDGVGDTAERNVISGNNGNVAVTVQGGAHDNLIAGNFIGLAANGQVLQNHFIGITVADAPSLRNRITRNDIYAPSGIGISLTGGANNSQNPPVMTAAHYGATTAVAGTLTSLASATFTLEFFANSQNNGTSGERYLSSITVTTDATGYAAFSANLPASTSTGEWITATVTDAAGNTSQFSDALRVAPPVSKASPNLVTTASHSIVSGDVQLTDSAILSGGVNETGTITFTLHAPDSSTQTLAPVTVSGDGAYVTPTYVVATQVGVYWWTAAYSGDAGNNPASDPGISLDEMTTTVANPTGGLSIGFWTNKNGQALETLADFSTLTALSLRTASGASQDFTATGATALATDKTSLAAWLKGATATNMAYMLSVQLAAAELAVLKGFVNATSYVDLNLISVVYNTFGSSSALLAAVNTSPYGALTDAYGIVQIQSVMNAANTVLGTAAGSNTVAGSLLRSYEEALKDVLDAINNNQLIVLV
jgi:hypothetical protein